LSAFGRANRRALNAALASSTIFAACFLGFCLLSAGLIFVLGRGLFPQSGRRADPHTLSRAHRVAHRRNRPSGDQVDEVIRETIPKEELQTILDNLGLPYSGNQS